MRVLVTGGAGYIGSHMVLELLDHGHFVAVIDNLSTGSQHLINQDSVFKEACISDSSKIASLIRQHNIDTIIHFAALISLPQSMHQPMRYYQNNLAFAHSLLQTAIDNNIKRFVFSSTAAVYDPGDGTPLSETAPLLPKSPYGSSKLMFEKILQDAAAAHDFAFAILRYFNVAGADPAGRSGRHSNHGSSLIQTICKAAGGTAEPIPVYGNDYKTPDGTGIRDFIHVTDLVATHRLALERFEKDAENQLINCGTGKGTSVLEAIQAAEEILGHPLPVQLKARRPGDLPKVLADNSKIKRTLNWEPRYPDIHTMLEHELAWEAGRSAGQKGWR